jgi:hypothetical protein
MASMVTICNHAQTLADAFLAMEVGDCFIWSTLVDADMPVAVIRVTRTSAGMFRMFTAMGQRRIVHEEPAHNIALRLANFAADFPITRID